MKTRKQWIAPEVTEIEINASGTGNADATDKS